MAAPIKAVLGGLALVGVGGTGVWMMYTENMPAWRPLSQDSDFLSGSSVDDKYKNKFAEKNARFLVGVGTDKTTGEGSVDNASWWDWSFRNRYPIKTDSEEDRKSFGSGVDSGEKLKEACKNAYGGTVDTSDSKKIKVSQTGGGSKEYLETHIWLFCSYLGKKPVLLKESTESSESEYKQSKAENPKWGQVSDVHELLISTESEENVLFWERQQKDLEENIDGAHKFFTAKKSEGIRSSCKAAYAASKPNSDTDSSDTAPSKDELLKYCSVNFQVAATEK